MVHPTYIFLYTIFINIYYNWETIKNGVPRGLILGPLLLLLYINNLSLKLDIHFKLFSADDTSVLISGTDMAKSKQNL
jgi:hypothetical protein